MTTAHIRFAVLALALAGAAACSSTTSSTGPAPAAAGLTPAAAGAASAASGGSGDKALSCSSLSAAQLTAALGGHPTAGATESIHTDGCSWQVSGSTLESADERSELVSLDLYSSDSIHDKATWVEAETGLGSTAIPDVGGNPAYYSTDLDVLSIWDGTRDVKVQFVALPRTVPDEARIQAAVIMLASDVFAS